MLGGPRGNLCGRSHRVGSICTRPPSSVRGHRCVGDTIYLTGFKFSPELTWRDIQHLCVRTALQINSDDPDWERTAAGRLYSYKYGYGRLDAWQFVHAAMTWPLVKPQAWAHLPLSRLGGGSVDRDGTMWDGLPIVPAGVGSTLSVSHDLLLANGFERLEHVTVTVWINHTRRGDVEVELHSPNGIGSVLAARRRYDDAPGGFPGWTFMTLKHWLVPSAVCCCAASWWHHLQGREPDWRLDAAGVRPEH